MEKIEMKALNSCNTRLSTPSYLQFCHRPHFFSPKSPFLTLLLPIKHQTFSLQTTLPSNYRKPNSSQPIGSSIWSSMASSTPQSTETRPPISVLFVCLGNICRSPAAEGVFTDIVKKKGLESKFKIDSAGTINYHEGNPADPRMRAAAKRRGIEITSISRPIQPSDFCNFDFILAMDKQNRDNILEAFNRWKYREPLPEDAHKKVRLMCSYCKKHDESEVPDPYYGGPQGFETVLDLLEDACGSLLDTILAENSHLLE